MVDLWVVYFHDPFAPPHLVPWRVYQGPLLYEQCLAEAISTIQRARPAFPAFKWQVRHARTSQTIVYG